MKVFAENKVKLFDEWVEFITYTYFRKLKKKASLKKLKIGKKYTQASQKPYCKDITWLI